MPRNRDDSDICFTPSDSVRSLKAPWSSTILNPDMLYRVSGEAVLKTEQLRREIAEFIPAILARPPFPHIEQFAEQVHAALAETDHLIAFLLKARGKHVYLECEWEDGHVKCRGTSPRG